MSAAFGVVGFCWRRLPDRLHHAVTPAGLVLCALAYLAISTGLGPLTWTGLVLAGVGMGLATSPLLTQALLHVPPAQASDASGLLNTTMQLGQVLGIAIVGTVYYALLAGEALSYTTRLLVVISVAGALIALFLARGLRR